VGAHVLVVAAVSLAVGERVRAAGLRDRLSRVEQGSLVLALIGVIILFGALTTDGFLTTGNFRVILRFSSAFGIVAVAQAFVVLGKGVDLSVGAVALVAGQLTLELMGRGWSESSAVLTVVVIALVTGAVNGVLVAYVGIPALFVTLGTGQLLLGGANVWLLGQNLYTVPPDTTLGELGRGVVAGMPMSVVYAGAVFVLAWLCWSYTSYGRLVRAVGDNYDTARVSGSPVRPVQASTYVIAALLSTFAGYLIMAREGSVVTTGSAFNPLLFTALTAVVIGGVSLSGGRGTILGVLAGTVFIGLVTNLLILNSLSPALQDLARGLTLVVAVVLDAWLHPRDEETAKSGEL
jgi:ribose transport system permease protein